MYQHMGHTTIVSVRMINTYHYTKPEPTGFLGCQETAGPVNLNLGPWGPLTSPSWHLKEEEETEEKTKHHNQKIYAGLHPGIGKKHRVKLTWVCGLHIWHLSLATKLYGYIK